VRQYKTADKESRAEKNCSAEKNKIACKTGKKTDINNIKKPAEAGGKQNRA